MWTTGIITALAGLGSAIAVLWLVRRWFYSMVATARAKLDALAAGRIAKRVDDRARFFGVGSKSAAQLRGNGVLALYETELIFVQLMIDRVIRIPIDAIVEVTTAKSFKGKTIFRDLLTITWRLDGGTETVGLFVVDLQGWLAALKQAQPSASAPA